MGAFQKALADIKKVIVENDSAVEHIAVGLLGRQFVWLDGESGGAKTNLSRLILYAELAGLKETEKRKDIKVFMQQMHQMITEGTIVGFPKMQRYLEKGDYEIETSTSLVGEDYLLFLLDELEKCLPAVQTKLLSVLAERKALLGSKVLPAFIMAGIATSNKTTGQLLESAGEDRPGIEALMDRFGIKHTMQHVFLNDSTSLQMRQKRLRPTLDRNQIVAHFSALTPLLEHVSISDRVLEKVAEIIHEYSIWEQQLEEKEAAEGKPPLLTNQFSNRSVKELVLRTLKSQFLIHQLASGVPFDQIRTTLEEHDLVHLQTGMLLGGPGSLKALANKGEIKIEDDGRLQKYLDTPYLQTEDKEHALGIQTRRRNFARYVELGLTGKTQSSQPEKSLAVRLPLRPNELKEMVAQLPSAQEREKEKLMYEITRHNLQVMEQYFMGMGYAIERVADALVGHHNAMLFGGPGSAKSMLADMFADAETKGLNILNGTDAHERFFLQFDKQTPIGLISGFPIPSQQIEHGKRVFNYRDSLVNPKFKIAVLDEVDKANVATLTALFGVLNPAERSAFNGQEVKAGITTAILTGNALPMQLLELFKKGDRDSGRALLERIQQKVYVINKMLTSEDLATYLKSQRDGKAPPELFGGTYLSLLRPLSQRVRISGLLQALAIQINREHLTREVRRYQDTRKGYQESPLEYPYYYLPSSEASSRTEMMVEDVAQAAYIVRQLMEGVPYDALSFDMTVSDLDLLFLPYLYGGPAKLEWVSNTTLGLPQLTIKKRFPTQGIDVLLPQDKYFLQEADSSLVEFVNTVNKVIQQHYEGHRDIVAKYPELYPELFLRQGTR